MEQNNLLIKKVWVNKKNKQKCVTIPQGVEYILDGDYVSITKINKKDISK